MSNIDAAALKLYGYQTYATFHDTLTEQDISASTQSMPVTLYFPILTLSCPDIIFLSLPWTTSTRWMHHFFIVFDPDFNDFYNHHNMQMFFY
jgi:hypothetical protein